MTLLLLNLLENALKYGVSEDRKQIRVSLRRVEDQLSLAVSDTGPGIPRDELPRIFDRFYRTRAVRSMVARGSGIGLSLVKQIVTGHGGRVHVKSDLGNGATFEVTIPIRTDPRTKASTGV